MAASTSIIRCCHHCRPAHLLGDSTPPCPFTEKVSDKNWQVNKSRNIISSVINHGARSCQNLPPPPPPPPTTHHFGRLLSQHHRPTLKKGANFTTPERKYAKQFGAKTPGWKLLVACLFPACCDSGAEDADTGAGTAFTRITPLLADDRASRAPQCFLSTPWYTEVFTDVSSHVYYSRSHCCSSPLEQHSYYEHTLTFTADNLQMCVHPTLFPLSCSTGDEAGTNRRS